MGILSEVIVEQNATAEVLKSVGWKGVGVSGADAVRVVETSGQVASGAGASGYRSVET
jgi:hypothetical protein